MKLIQNNELILEPGDFGLYKPIPRLKLTLRSINLVEEKQNFNIYFPSLIALDKKVNEIIIEGSKELTNIDTPVDIKVDNTIYKTCRIIGCTFENNKLIYTLQSSFKTYG